MSSDISSAMLQDEAKESDKRKGYVGGTIAFVLIVIILLFPFFTTEFPIPESEGLAVSFGNVELAGGGDNLDPNTPVSPNTPPPPEPIEDTEVEPTDEVDDPEAEAIPDTKPEKPKPTPKPQTKPEPAKPNYDPNALFPPSTGGTGTGSGPGQQGRPDGTGDDPLGKGTGSGDKGDGTGKVGNRSIRQRCDALNASTDWNETGTVWVFICVDESGKVVSAEAQSRTQRGDLTTITSGSQRKVAVDCAKQYRYEPAPGMGKACGSIPIHFRKQ